ncbi:MAG: hypothetical protein IKX27_07330, partial [Oscillospiraceae bacterium]|nr:hypothetical protein [Oscillospiraceae bacterium]
QREAYNWLSQNENLSDEERNALWSLTSKSWQKSYDEYEPQNETLVNNADEDGDGRVTQEEAYNWLSQQKDMSDSEKAILWSQNGWKKAYDEYARSEQKKEAAADLGYTLKNLTEVADSDKSGTLKQAELYNWLQSQNFSEDEKSKLWDLGGWKTDYQSYSAKQKGKTSTDKATETKTTASKTTETKPSDPSKITNRKELLIAADSNNDGYMSQKEAYTYLSGTDLSEEEKEALWNLSNWKTSYQKYAQKNG